MCWATPTFSWCTLPLLQDISLRFSYSSEGKKDGEMRIIKRKMQKRVWKSTTTKSVPILARERGPTKRESCSS